MNAVVALSIINLAMLMVLFVYMVVKLQRYSALNREARELMELARQQQQIALDTVQGVRLAARGAQMDLKRTAEATADKLKDVAATTAALKAERDESGVVHLPAGAEMRIKAEPDGGPESRPEKKDGTQ